jgi:hypothetical protein
VHDAIAATENSVNANRNLSERNMY